MEQEEQLLSNKWENSYLHEVFNESLQFLRRKKINYTNEENFKETDFFKNTPIFLVDHPKLNLYHADVLVVSKDSTDDRTMIFVFKDGLTEELNKQSLPESKEVVEKVHQYIEKVGLDVMRGQHKSHVIISKDIFVELLKSANLDNVVEKLDLEKTLSKKLKM